MTDTMQREESEQNIRVVPIMATLLTGGFIGMFSETALNMAMNDLISEFSITPSTAQWLTTGYLLVLGILIPVTGLLIKRYPTRLLLMTSFGFSIAGAFVAGISPNFPVLLSGRIIQAVGTGLIMPLLFHAVLVLIPPRKRGMAMGLVGLVLMFAPALGPISAGLIIDYFNWHMIFWMIIPFLIFAFTFGAIYLPNISQTSKYPVDLLSIILSTLGFGGIVFGFSYAGESGGWSSPVVITTLLAGAIALMFYVFRQLALHAPVLNLKVFKKPMFILGIVVTLFANIIIFSGNILLPLFMQAGLGFSPSKAGFLLLPGGIINGIMSMVNGRIFDIYGPRGLVIGGFVLSTGATLFFATVTSSTHAFWIILFFMFLMVSMSMVTTPSQTNGLNQLESDQYPDGTAVVNSMIQISGAMGTAIAMSILSSSQSAFLSRVSDPEDPANQAEAVIIGVQNAFTLALVVSLLGLICVLFIRRVRVH